MAAAEGGWLPLESIVKAEPEEFLKINRNIKPRRSNRDLKPLRSKREKKTKRENFSEPLEPMIRYEPAERQDLAGDQIPRQSIDDILRARANIFSDPIVHLERLPAVFEDFRVSKANKSHSARKKAKSLSRKGSGETSCTVQLKITSILEHAKTKTLNPKASCSKCKTLIPTSELDCHLCSAHTPRVKCPECNKLVKSLKKHLKKSHRQEVSCAICEKLVASSSLEEHLRNHEKEKCDKCEEMFEDKEDLRKHKLKMHYKNETNKSNFGDIFAFQPALPAHQKSHNSETLPCDFCSKNFATVKLLNLHYEKKHHQQLLDLQT